jgi:hypothetical protein
MASLLTYKVQFLPSVRTWPVTARTVARRPQIPVRPAPACSAPRKVVAHRVHPLLAFVGEAVWIVLLALMLVVGTRVMYAFVAVRAMPVAAVHVDEAIAPVPDDRAPAQSRQPSSEGSMRTM